MESGIGDNVATPDDDAHRSKHAAPRIFRSQTADTVDELSVLSLSLSVYSLSLVARRVSVATRRAGGGATPTISARETVPLGYYVCTHPCYLALGSQLFTPGRCS